VCARWELWVRSVVEWFRVLQPQLPTVCECEVGQHTYTICRVESLVAFKLVGIPKAFFTDSTAYGPPGAPDVTLLLVLALCSCCRLQ
jgi:hypothetical protein